MKLIPTRSLITKLAAVAGLSLAAASANGQAIKVENTNPNFGFKLTSAQLNGDNNCSKIGFDRIVLDDSGVITVLSKNQGIITKKDFADALEPNTDSMTCNIVMAYETDSKTKITPTEGRTFGSASIAPGHRVGYSTKIATSSKTRPQENSDESWQSPVRIKLDLSTMPMKKMGEAIPCGLKDKVTMNIKVFFIGSSSDPEGSEIRLGADKIDHELEDGSAARKFSTFGFTSSSC